MCLNCRSRVTRRQTAISDSRDTRKICHVSLNEKWKRLDGSLICFETCIDEQQRRLSEGCTAPFERLIPNNSTPLLPIILQSRGSLHEVDGGRKRKRNRCAGDSEMSRSCALLLTGCVASRTNCHFTVLSALCSAGLLLWHKVFPSLSCGRTVWDLSLFLIPHLGWTFICFLHDFGRLLSDIIYGTVVVEWAYIRIWLWSDNRDKVSLLKCYYLICIDCTEGFLISWNLPS